MVAVCVARGNEGLGVVGVYYHVRVGIIQFYEVAVPEPSDNHNVQDPAHDFYLSTRHVNAAPLLFLLRTLTKFWSASLRRSHSTLHHVCTTSSSAHLLDRDHYHLHSGRFRQGMLFAISPPRFDVQRTLDSHDSGQVTAARAGGHDSRLG